MNQEQELKWTERLGIISFATGIPSMYFFLHSMSCFFCNTFEIVNDLEYYTGIILGIPTFIFFFFILNDWTDKEQKVNKK